MSGIEFAVNPSRILATLLAIIAVLVALSTAGQAMIRNVSDFPFRDAIATLFFLDAPQSLPDLYSVLMLLISALLFGVIAHAQRGRSGRFVRHWAALSVVFVLLAIDESAELHEQGSGAIRSLLDVDGGVLWFAWVVPGLLAVAVFGIAFIRFLKHLPPATRRGMWTAGILFLSGALGAELLGGWYASAHGQDAMGYVLIATVEESLEMVGVAVLVYALLAYIAIALPDAAWRIRVRTTQT